MQGTRFVSAQVVLGDEGAARQQGGAAASGQKQGATVDWRSVLNAIRGKPLATSRGRDSPRREGIRMHRRHLLAATAGAALPGFARAQTAWPVRPVRIVVPFGL